jgi:hypothetical protein
VDRCYTSATNRTLSIEEEYSHAAKAGEMDFALSLVKLLNTRIIITAPQCLVEEADVRPRIDHRSMINRCQFGCIPTFRVVIIRIYTMKWKFKIYEHALRKIDGACENESSPCRRLAMQRRRAVVSSGGRSFEF